MAEYRDIMPDAPERILRMAESQTIDRARLEERLVVAEIEGASTGRSLAFVITFAALVAAIVFFALGKDLAGALLLSMPVVMLVRAFLGDLGKTGSPVRSDDSRPTADGDD